MMATDSRSSAVCRLPSGAAAVRVEGFCNCIATRGGDPAPWHGVARSGSALHSAWSDVRAAPAGKRPASHGRLPNADDAVGSTRRGKLWASSSPNRRGVARPTDPTNRREPRRKVRPRSIGGGRGRHVFGRRPRRCGLGCETAGAIAGAVDTGRESAQIGNQARRAGVWKRSTAGGYCATYGETLTRM